MILRTFKVIIFHYFWGSLCQNQSASQSRASEFSQTCHYHQKMRRDAMVMGMTVISQIVQQNLYNFPNYGVQATDSRSSAAGPTHRLRNYSRAATTWELLLYLVPITTTATATTTSTTTTTTYMHRWGGCGREGSTGSPSGGGGREGL